MPKLPTLLDETVLMRSYDGSTVNERPSRHSIVDLSCGSSARPLVEPRAHVLRRGAGRP